MPCLAGGDSRAFRLVLHDFLKQVEEQTLQEVDRLERLVAQASATGPLHLISKDGSPVPAVCTEWLPPPIRAKAIELDDRQVSPNTFAPVSKRLGAITESHVSVGDQLGTPSAMEPDLRYDSGFSSEEGAVERADSEHDVRTNTKGSRDAFRSADTARMSRAQVQFREAIRASKSGLPPPETTDVRTTLKRMWRDKIMIGLVLDSVMGFVILLNCAAIGISSDVHPLWGGWIAIDGMFAGIFIIEFCLQLHLQGGREYWCGSDWRWHIFEVALVVLAVLEVVLALFATQEDGGPTNNFSLLRIMRLVRITRLLRVCRLEIFCDLIVMVKGTLGGIKTLLWSSVLISLPLYAVSLLFRETLGVHWADGHGAEAFRTVPLSFFTSFRCIVAGECTDKEGRPLFSLIVDKYGWGYGIVYCASEVFMTFGLFNVIVAIFVENVLAGAKTNDQMLKQQRLRDEAFWGTKMLEMSNLICETHRRMTGQRVTVSEEHMTAEMLLMEAHAIQITPELYEHLRKIEAFADILRDLDVSDEDSEHLFDTLDADASGAIDIEELLVGIAKLRGEARRSDIVSVNLKMNNVLTTVDEEFKQLNARLSKYDADMKTLLHNLCFSV